MSVGDRAVSFFARRDLLGEDPGRVEALWELPYARSVLRRQLPQGHWRYPNPRARERSPLQDYDQLETYRRLGQLVEKCGMDRSHPAIRSAAEYLFGRQTEDGDFRGIYGRQYTPNYSAGITELLVKAGYGGDGRIVKSFRWLLSNRQDDGGWAIPFRTAAGRARGRVTHLAITSTTTAQPDRCRPSSHMVTGVVLRAFAAHESYRMVPEARAAALLLPPRFFRRDAYVDRGAPEFWARVTFPFWFTDVVSALDSLSLLGARPLHDGNVSRALSWLLRRQARDGTFALKLLKTGDPLLRWWETLAVARVFTRYAS